MKQVILVMTLFTIFSLSSCKYSGSKKTTKTEPVPSNNLINSAKEWKAVTDELGSSSSPKNISISNDQIEVDFTLKKKEEGEIVFIELVCDLGHNLVGNKGLSIDYKCETPLVIKLSQSDFGKNGNESYAHFQFVVPASDTITTAHLKFSEFTQPVWTPDYSKGIPMKLENVDAIYLTPKVDEATGGSSSLAVMGLYLKKQ